MRAMPRATLRSAVVDPQTAWTRRRLQVLLGTATLLVLAFLAVGVWSLASLATSELDATDGPSDGPLGTAEGTVGSGDVAAAVAEDEVAMRPLPDASLEAAQPGRLSSEQAGTLHIPPPTRVEELGVAAGFPQTPEGALAQLAAIDAAALTSASVRVAQAVIEQWADPGGPTPENWSGVRAMTALLESAGTPSDARDAITVSVEPAMGFIKGTVGADFVVPCIDFIVTATLTAPAGTGAVAQPRQVAAADCQRMVWRGDRWMVGAGDEPAAAPSLWPGSQASFDAGYEWLEVPQT